LSARSSPSRKSAVRIRGTIERVDGAVYVVKARDGAELKLTLADKRQIAGIIKASLSDIKQNSFVGVTAMPQPDGSLSAVEVHIFPEAMRGTGEGHYPWDLQPQSTMTNANVEQVVSAVDGRTLTLKYKDGEKKITIPASAPIVTYVPATRPTSNRAPRSSSSLSNKPTERCKAGPGGSAATVSRRQCERGRSLTPRSGADSDEHNGLFRCGAAAKYGVDHLSFSSRRGGRVVECTALEMRHTGNRIGGSNPSLSATLNRRSFRLQLTPELAVQRIRPATA
jgi:hypothetical protein